MAKYKSIFAKYNKSTFNVQKCTLKEQKYRFKVQKYTFKVQNYTFNLQKHTFKVQKHTFKVYVQRTTVHFQITKRYFQRTKAYSLSTKWYFQSLKAYCQRRKVYLQSTTSILSTFNVQKHTFKVQKYTFKVQEYTFEVQSNCRKPWPGTFLIPRVPGTWFPETVPSKPREQNLTPRNPSNTKTFETSFTQPSEPEPWNRKTCRNPSKPGSGSQNWFPEPVPGTGSRNPVPGTAPARPEHTEIYIAQRPHSILLLGKKMRSMYRSGTRFEFESISWMFMAHCRIANQGRSSLSTASILTPLDPSRRRSHDMKSDKWSKNCLARLGTINCNCDMQWFMVHALHDMQCASTETNVEEKIRKQNHWQSDVKKKNYLVYSENFSQEKSWKCKIQNPKGNNHHTKLLAFLLGTSIQVGWHTVSPRNLLGIAMNHPMLAAINYEVSN